MRLTKPWVDERESEEIASVLPTGYWTQGPKVAQFEQMVAELVGSRYALGTSSCTTALFLSLVALGIGPGDEVLVADFTHPATANVVVHRGATPVLVDIELETFTMDVYDMMSKLTRRARAIIPVQAFGCSADMTPILKAAEDCGAAIIEDAASAIGAKYHDRYCGNIGTLGCFSFHPRKVVATGEGGIITTSDDHLADRIGLLRREGAVRVGYWYEFQEAGYNFRLSDLLGAVGVAQMEKLPMLIERRQSLARQLGERMASIPGIRPPVAPPWGGHIYQSFVILVDEGIDRDRAVRDLRARDIEASLGAYALHDQPFYQREYGYVSGQLRNSHAAFMRAITLPLYPQMCSEDLDEIAARVEEVIILQRKP